MAQRVTRHPASRIAARIGALAVFYVAGAKLGLALSFSHEHVTSVWPPTGIAVAALMIFGLRVWPGIFIGAVVANLADGTSLQVALAIGVGNTLAPVAAASLMRRVRVRTSLERLRDVLWLALGGGLGAMTISATLGTAVLYAAGENQVSAAWRVWWVGDAMGVILLAPLLLTLFSKPLRESRMANRWKQSALLLTSFTVMTLLAVQTKSPAGYVVIPLGLWIAMQLEQEGAAAAALIMSGIDLWHTTMAPEPGMTIERQLMAIQGVNATIALILLAFAVVMYDRRRARDDLRHAALDLEDRVRDRTQALGESEARLAQAQRLAHIGSFQWDAQRDENEWSDELFRIYGLAPDDGPPSFDEYIAFIRSDVRDEVSASIQQGIAEAASMNHEYPVVLQDGTRKWVQAHIEVLKDHDGNLTGLRGTCQDVTERRVAEEARRASETRLRALVRSAPDGVVVADERGRIVLMNEQTTHLLGYDTEELLGSSVDVLLPEGLREAHRSERKKYLQDPAVRPMGAGHELSARHKDGALVPVDISLSPVETDEGTLVFALIRDASERRQVEEALRSALDKERRAATDLRRLDDAKSSFLSAVSHELRTPLTAILGFAELMQEDDVRGSEETMTLLVERLRFSAQRLGTLLTDLLDIDRLQRGVLVPQRRVALLRDVVDRALVAIDLRAHAMQVHVDDGFATVDPAQTERIIENLVSNAVKYTPPGSLITVVGRMRENGGVEIVVEDDGPGIPDDMHTSIFEPFVRGDIGSFTPGTGVGLSLVDRFAQLHGGRAWVENRDGPGASFHVELPGDAGVLARPDVA